MQIILFYGRDGAKAKARAKEIRDSKNRVMCCDVTVWEGTKDGDRAEIMDCVSYFDRQRIEHVFGVKVERGGGNIFADIGCENPEEQLAKAEAIVAQPKKRGRPRKVQDAA